jgi:hypothetical protein
MHTVTRKLSGVFVRFRAPLHSLTYVVPESSGLHPGVRTVLAPEYPLVR